ncbi:AI-2E family transporter [Arthrobacter roseus]|uniref:AI-2E family transporter n=1 Tax=Arthrobacter roseus TaxID=136274 RepID=UPI001964C102|nr:AI-2E family transporter [Arthrobacter roseus]MBM7847565.1 putative PurR-regulated permease PerM [Arthrobacter roseus]
MDTTRDVGPEANPAHGDSVNRRRGLTAGFASTVRWVAGGIVIVVGLVVLWYTIGYLWSVAFPILLALLLSSILWPVNRAFRRFLPKPLAALLTVVLVLTSLYAIIRWMVPALISESAELAEHAQVTLTELSRTFTQPPFNLQDADLNNLLDTAVEQVRENTTAIVSGVTSGIYTSLGLLTSAVVTTLLVLVFVFFCLKDGDRVLPWAAHWTNAAAYKHIRAISTQAWSTLSGYIGAQAAVALVDAVFIGLGLWILDIPLAMPLTVLIFFAAFIPIVGAVTTGLLAALIALISDGWVTGLIVLGIVVLVQQLESNLLQPVLVGRTLKIHPAVVLASVTVAGTLFGIAGAFLAVPIAAVAIVVLRYVRDQSFTPAHPCAADAGMADAGTEHDDGDAMGDGDADGTAPADRDIQPDGHGASRLEGTSDRARD